jgi:hypothetical protein
MRGRIVGGLAAVIVVIAAALGIAIWTGVLKLGLTSSACKADDEIDPPRRAAIDEAAMSFVRAALGSSPQSVFPVLTDEAQARAVSAKSFGEQLQILNRGSGPFADVHVANTYLVTDTGSSSATTVCGTLANDAWVSVATKPGLVQAHVVIAARSKNNDWAFTLWLVPDGAGWRVQDFHVGMSSIVGRTPDVLLALGQKERAAGRAFNAAIVLGATQTVSDRGPSFQLAVRQKLQDERAKLELPDELRGQSPFTWTMNGVPYVVADASMIGVANEVGMVFVLPRTSWTSDDDAEAQSRAFIEAFVATHPDYAQAFSFLVARAMRPDGSGGFATVYRNGSGFVARQTAPRRPD